MNALADPRRRRRVGPECRWPAARRRAKPTAVDDDDATVTSTTTNDSTPFGLHVVRTGQQRLSPLYPQGVARVPGGWIFSATDSLWRTDDPLHVVKKIAPAIPDAWKAKGFNHVGDIDVVGQYIYAPFEEPDYTKGHQATARYDWMTLQFVDAVMLPQHQNSFVTIDPDHDDRLHDERVRRRRPAALRRRRTIGSRSRRCSMSQVLHHTQGGDVASRRRSGSPPTTRVHGVYRVDLADRSDGPRRGDGSPGRRRRRHRRDAISRRGSCT